jgi:hypothetical protein
MKKWGTVFLIFILLFFCKKSEGQVSNYVFTAFGGSYIPISGGTEVVSIEDDDVFSSPISIGFNFVFNSVTYTQVVASSNGWLSFNTGVTSSALTNNLSGSATTIRPLLAPLWDDLDGFDGPGFAYYQVSGSAPNRIFTFEWRNWEWQYAANVPVISFQVKLYETTNIIQFIYRNETGTISSSPSASIGIAGATTGSGNFLSLNNTSALPTASSVTETATLGSKPATGQVYQFAPPVCSGTPTGGTTASTANPACNGTPFTLSVGGATSGVSGLSYQWQSSPDGITWTNIGVATATTYTTSMVTTTWFRRSITCSGNSVNSSNLQVQVQTPTTTATPSSVCVNSSSVLTAAASAGSATLLSENFNGAAAGWTTINNSTGGSSPANAAWTLHSSPYTYNGTLSFTFSSNDASQFYLTNSDAAGTGVAVSTILQSPSFSTVGYSSCSLQFYHHFHYFLSGETAKVEVSTNGSTWTTLQTYTADQGTESAFVLATISLNTYINNATVFIRFKYDAAWDWFWAIDNVTITGTPTAATYAWAASPATGAGLPAGAGTLSAANNSITVTPTSVGNITYTVSTNNSCFGTANVVVASATGALVTAASCKSQTINTGDNYFMNGTCNLIARVIPSGSPAVAGLVSACVKIEVSVLTDVDGHPYVQRHYDIEPATGAATAQALIKLYFTAAEFLAYNSYVTTNLLPYPLLPTGTVDNGNARITQFHGTGTALGNYTGGIDFMVPILTWDAANNWWEVSVPVIGFSGFYLHTGTRSLLAGKDMDFFAKQTGRTNTLYWTTYHERNTRKFIMERSTDGRIYSDIGEQVTLASNGNSNTILNYSFVDENPVDGKQYYRIQTEDIFGNKTYSAVVSLWRGVGKMEITDVYPNPGTGTVHFNISGSHAKVSVAVLDLNGKEIIQKGQVQSFSFYVDLSKLANGMYMLEATDVQNGEKAIYKIVKN